MKELVNSAFKFHEPLSRVILVESLSLFELINNVKFDNQLIVRYIHED